MTVAMELKHVNKKIGSKEIIKDLSFTVNRGEVFGFIGPNGAGKTTTIRMMVGLIGITSGDIQISGKSIKTDFKEAVAEVGAIVENPEMYPFMTGMQNLKHFARMVPGVSKERIEEIVQLVGLDKAVHEKVRRYSLGMRQRLGIAQALLHNPSVLILDEPTNGLDPSGMREIRQHIRRVATKENVAVIISSHLLSEIELMCDRIGIIKNGTLIATQDVHEDVNDIAEGMRQVEMEVRPTEKALELVRSTHGIEATIEAGSLHFQCKKEIVPDIVRSLVGHQLDVFQVNVTRATLEDKFLDMIGENVIE